MAQVEDYLFCDDTSPDSASGAADMQMGEVPSPTRTASPEAIRSVVRPLAAEIAPASIRLARAARNAFFMVRSLLSPSRADKHYIKVRNPNKQNSVNLLKVNSPMD